ncbi:hypothetical protein [Methanobrevibacter sp. UBA212]|uniref:hypothetical protein n=1 Tax=Methanobrevibacter sp. UBA212 TaxID=1915476 RepID=UPI0025F65BF3|nr:hypothetical protein [Methanobrevibacter sp. UBA212]
MIKLHELLDKYKIDYTKFPEGILDIEINNELDNFTNFSKESNNVYVFKGEYISVRRVKELTELVKIVIDLRNLPSQKKIRMVKEIMDDENNELEKYDMPLTELMKTINEVKSKRVVFYYKNIKGNTFGNYYNYDIFGERRAQS